MKKAASEDTALYFKKLGANATLVQHRVVRNATEKTGLSFKIIHPNSTNNKIL